MSELRTVVDATEAVLLDFDGPTCDVFAGCPASGIAGDMRASLAAAGVQVPRDIAEEDDPLAVLRWTAQSHGDLVGDVEDILCAAEVLAVETARPTPFVVDMIDAATRTGRQVIVVSNNSERAIAKFFATQGLAAKIAAIVGRPPGEPLKMKPAPDLLLHAAKILDTLPKFCVMIGDSVTDIVASKQAGAHSIGFAKSEARGLELKQAGADSIIASLDPLALALLETRRS